MPATASTTVPRPVYVAGVAVYAAASGTALLWLVRYGSSLGLLPAIVLTAAAAWMVSFIPMGLLAQFYEDPRVAENRTVVHLLSDLRDQSYAFVFGDGALLVFSAVTAMVSWSHLTKAGWRVSWQWTLASALVGLFVALDFRYRTDKPNFDRCPGSYRAPTKYFHDFCGLLVLFAVLFGTGVPLFVLGVGGSFRSSACTRRRTRGSY